MEQKTNRSKMSTEELSEAVNLVKLDNSGVFTVKDIRKALKAKGIPMSSEFATTLVQHGYIVKAGLTFQDGYSWSNTEPIHMNKVAELVAITRKRVAAQARKYYHKKEAVRQAHGLNNLKKLQRLNRYLKKFQFMNIRSLYQLIRQLIRLLSCLLRMGIEFLNLSLYMRK